MDSIAERTESGLFLQQDTVMDLGIMGNMEYSTEFIDRVMYYAYRSPSAYTESEPMDLETADSMASSASFALPESTILEQNRRQLVLGGTVLEFLIDSAALFAEEGEALSQAQDMAGALGGLEGLTFSDAAVQVMIDKAGRLCSLSITISASGVVEDIPFTERITLTQSINSVTCVPPRPSPPPLPPAGRTPRCRRPAPSGCSLRRLTAGIRTTSPALSSAAWPAPSLRPGPGRHWKT